MFKYKLKENKWIRYYLIVYGKTNNSLKFKGTHPILRQFGGPMPGYAVADSVSNKLNEKNNNLDPVVSNYAEKAVWEQHNFPSFILRGEGKSKSQN